MNEFSEKISVFWSDHKNDEKYISILNENDFWFGKAVELLNEWKNKQVANIDELINLGYKGIKNSNDSKIIEVRELLFNIIAYCDTNASESTQRNPEKRIIAKSGVYQNCWVDNLLKWKREDIITSKSFIHAIEYLQKPQENLTMLSESHREKFSLNVLKKAYEEPSFCKEVLDFCKKSLPNIEIKNEDNRTWFYSCLIYDLKNKWLVTNVLGLVARDNTGWQSDLLSKKYCSVGWDQVSDLNDLKNELRVLIDKNNSFPFYNISESRARYRGDVIDFATNEEEFKERHDEWSEKNLEGTHSSFEGYGKSGKPKIILLFDKFIELDKPIKDNQFSFYKNKQPRVKNMVGFTKIITDEDKKMVDLEKLLKEKKNIILQGAPGTGKTYNTAELALRIIEKPPEKQEVADDKSFHDQVMKKYESSLIKINKDGSFANPSAQIGFVTFHQSMDYEDFVEGIKPSLEKNDNDDKASQVVYDVEDGIFKTIAQQAAKDTGKKYVLIIDEINRGNVSKIFGELISLLEADKRAGADHPLSVILPFSKESFSVPQNLYIIGTMNTTDRSVGSIDYAVRRRFAFVTLEADKDLVPTGDARNLFDSVKNFLDINKYDMDIEDLMVGHSYFMDAENLQMKWQYEILPLLMEYHKDGITSKSPLKKADDSIIENVKTEYKPFIDAWKKDEKKS